MIGLKSGTVKLYDHEKAWETEAQNTISRLKRILGSAAKDIQHIGSTAIPSIKAKPIIDIAVAADAFGDILAYENPLKRNGFFYRPAAGISNQLLFACGSFYDGTGDLQTHFIHVVLTGSMDWINYINFRDYLNKTPQAAKAYEALKLSLAQAAPIDSGREKYLKGKQDFIAYTLRKALVDSYLGKTVTLRIDRPVGYVHKKEKYTLVYPINYGYIPGVLGGDGEELDVYVLGEDKPLSTFTGKVIGIVHRENDCEDKLVAAPEGRVFTQNEIAQAVDFQEKYYQTRIEGLYHKSCGAVVFRRRAGKKEYLLLLQNESRTWSFPKGHMEAGETERQTATREIYEETGYRLALAPEFRMAVHYTVGRRAQKEVVLFLAEAAGEPRISPDEITEYRWATAAQATALLYPQYADIIRQAEARP